jgi:hypothetical protein
VEPHEELSDEVDGHDDCQDGLALLLLLVLQLDGHQAVVELGNLEKQTETCLRPVSFQTRQLISASG